MHPARSPVGGCLRKPNRSPASLLAKGTVKTFDLERARPATLAGLAVALALLMPTGVLAQSSSRTFYDAHLLSWRYPERFLLSALAPKYLILLARPERFARFRSLMLNKPT